MIHNYTKSFSFCLYRNSISFNSAQVYFLGSCAPCNNHLSGNIADYRINLINKIGVEKLEWLEGPHKPKKYTCTELKEIELLYKQKLKDLL